MRTNKIVERFTHGPRKAFGMSIPKIVAGETANLTYFDPSETFIAQTKHSLGVASPYEGVELQGKVLGVIS